MCRTALALSVVVSILMPSLASAADVSAPRHEVIAADRGKIIRFNQDGEAVWTYDLGSPVHRIQQLPNGNLLTQQGWGRLVEITPEKEIAWSYDAANSNGNQGKTVEVHTFERLDNGQTMVVENGVGRVIEIDAQGKLTREFPFQVSRPDAHHDVRQAHVLENGHVLICHEADGRVTEYDRKGKIVWDYTVPLFDRQRRKGHGLKSWGNQVFNALRLENGNTLMTTGNGHGVIEVTPDKKVVWALHQNDLPGIALAWTTSLEVLPNGNLIIGNCHAGPKNPQLIEITRDKQIVWTFRDFDLLGDATAVSATVGENVRR